MGTVGQMSHHHHLSSLTCALHTLLVMVSSTPMDFLLRRDLGCHLLFANVLERIRCWKGFEWWVLGGYYSGGEV